MTKTHFRLLLGLYLAVELASVAFGNFPSYSTGLADAYANEPASWLLQQPWLIGLLVPVAVLGFAGLIGLFLIRSWGRLLSVAFTVAVLALVPFAGPTLYSPLEDLASEAASLLWGVILALSYWSPLSGDFGANKSFKPNPLRGSA